MKKIIVALVALAIVLLGGGPAEAAKHKHKKNHRHTHACSTGQGVTHKHKHKRAKHHRFQKCRKVAAKPAEKVATRAEFNRLQTGMTVAQVQNLFDAPRIHTAHYFQALLVKCPPDSEFFCTDADGNGTGTVVADGGRDDYVWYTGKNIYDGRRCYSINTEFYDSLTEPGVFRLHRWENWQNSCPSRENRR